MLTNLLYEELQLCKENHYLTKKEEQIKQVAATMSIENMPLTKEAYANLYSIANGSKTTDEVITEIIAKYKQEISSMEL